MISVVGQKKVKGQNLNMSKHMAKHPLELGGAPQLQRPLGCRRAPVIPPSQSGSVPQLGSPKTVSR